VSSPDGITITPRRTLDAEPDFIFSNSPPGDRDLIGMSSPKAGVARIFDLKSGKDRLRLEGLAEVWDVAISSDERIVALTFSWQASANKANTQIRSLADGTLLFELPGGQNGTPRFNTTGSMLHVSGRGNAKGTWDTLSWKKLSLNFDGNFAVFADSSWVATSAFENILVWGWSGDLKFILEPPFLRATTFRLAVSPNKELLAALSSNNSLVIWNLSELETRLLMQ
jgi:WD40 repeat protein